MAGGLSNPSDKFAARVNASSDLSMSELLAVCTEELELKSLLLDGLADGILVHTVDGAILYFNPAAAVIYGHTPEEFARFESWEWVPPDRQAAIAELMRALRRNGHVDFESVGRTPLGATIATEVHARMIVLPGVGEVVAAVIRDVTERVAAHEMIRHLAFHDTLTGLANRVLLDERLRLAMSNADRHDDVVGLVYMDLDDFKPINDTHGHAAGDIVLKTVASRLLATVREHDTVARWGGDEFLALFPRLAGPDVLGHLGRKIHDCIREPIHVVGQEVRTSATLGLACYERGEAPDEFISRADRAMYHARGAGIDGWAQFECVD